MNSVEHANADKVENGETDKDAEAANQFNLSTDIAQPIQIQLNSADAHDSRNSSESSTHTHVDNDIRFSKDYISPTTTVVGDTLESHGNALLNNDTNPYYFPDKPYRFQRKWLLVAMTSLTFASIGINDSAVGALMPQMERYYNKSESIMSFSFLANSGGYLISTSTSSYLIHHLPLRYVLMIASSTYCGGSLIGTFRPPFAAMMVSFILTGFGGGLLDTAATSVIVHFEDGPLLTLTYSFFSIGSLASPFMVGGLRNADQPWELYFWFPFALAAFLFVLQWFVYRSYKAPIEHDALHVSATRKLKLIMTDSTIITSIVLAFCVFAMQDSWSQWASKYMQDTKSLNDGIPQIALGTFWAGVTVSRWVLSKLIVWIGETRSAVGCCVLFMITLAGIWVLNKDNVGGAIGINIVLGIVDGPFIPIVISTSSQSLPHYLKQPAVSAMVCGGLLGSSFIPLALGQAVNTFTTDIVPGVIIVGTAISVLLFGALYTTKYLRLARYLDEKPSIAGWIRRGANKDLNKYAKELQKAQNPPQLLAQARHSSQTLKDQP
ncbi:hypothetical protein E3P99_02463 [Wallemia hederae]|uniref:Major facilitator superfamily (MFS) profile domain-containing protein n=1 Tax=Wallemia hederae TaxID=1540922 RepID=A0A4T0FK99_9BASI|nr:hypothetical protein E3P99_02463 [Wallemia hederae]